MKDPNNKNHLVVDEDGLFYFHGLTKLCFKNTDYCFCILPLYNDKKQGFKTK